MADLELGYNASAYADGGLGARLAHDASLTLLYRFAQGRTLVASDGLGPTLAITRATEGRFFDTAGVLQTAASGVARFDHNPVTGESLGLLIEEARTNLALESQFITGAAPYAAIGVVGINANTAIAPDADRSSNGTRTRRDRG